VIRLAKIKLRNLLMSIGNECKILEKLTQKKYSFIAMTNTIIIKNKDKDMDVSDQKFKYPEDAHKWLLKKIKENNNG